MSDRILVATRKGLFTLARTGGAWVVDRVAFLGDNVTLVLADRRDERVYAALDHGHFGVKLHRSDDGGATFREVAAPAYPAPPADDPTATRTADGRELKWSLKLVWSLAAGGSDQPGLLWAGTIPGGLFMSKDRGDSWTLWRSLWDDPRRRRWFGGGADLPGIHSICVHPRESRHVTIGVSCGGVWVTRDGGERWELCADGMIARFMPPDQQRDPNVQDPHCVVQCAAAPDVLWAQHHNGIFRSTDGAASWHEVTDVKPSTFGFAVAVHPKDADTAWFVPALSDEKRMPVDGRVVVTRTRDGGRTFQTLTSGLPQKHAYDLVLRHALDVDGSGQRLAFGSTTGSVFVTEDQGEHWQHVSAHLPPVYAVRFA
jgi:hypothetical protein